MNAYRGQPMRVEGSARRDNNEWFEMVLTSFFLLMSASAIDITSLGVTAVSWARLFAWIHGTWHIAHLF